MKPRAIVLSGKVCAGKSTLAEALAANGGATLIKSKDLICERSPATARTRGALQRAGLRLDQESGGRWLSEALNKRVMNDGPLSLIVVDAVRIPEQVFYLRQSGWSVTHVHLGAGKDELDKRHASKATTGTAASYSELAKTWSERHVQSLKRLADVVIDTDRCSASDVFARVMARVETQRPVTAFPIIDVLIGGQYGSEGKGNIAHYLAPEYDVLVRVGGPNAGHKVFRPGEDPYTFRQLPSGALGNRDAMLVLGAGAVISLQQVLQEIADLTIPFDKLIIDPQAMIIESFDIEWEETHLKAAIGSTAQGIGSATARKILYRDPEKNVRLARDVPELKHYIRDTIEFFASCLSTGKKIMLEGTQGTSLSLHHGHYPHVTSRATTATACLAEAGLSARHVRRVAMVCRTYPIRVGLSVTGKTSGFMSQETSFEEIARRSGVKVEELTQNEIGSVSKRPRRVAEFDWAQLRRSLLLNGPTDIVLTFADYLGIGNREAYRYEQLNDETLRFIEEVEKVCGIPVSMISTAFNDRNIIDRRMW